MREEENDDQPGNLCSFFLNNLIIKEVLYTVTKTIVSFTNYKRAGWSPMWNKNKSGSSTFFRKETSWLQKRKWPHHAQKEMVGKVTQQPPDIRRSSPRLKIKLLFRFWKSTFKMDRQKTDVDFFKYNFEMGPPFWDRWHEVDVKIRCNNAPFWSLVITPGCISWQIGFVGLFKWGMWSNRQRWFFDWGWAVGVTRYEALRFRAWQRLRRKRKRSNIYELNG